MLRPSTPLGTTRRVGVGILLGHVLLKEIQGLGRRLPGTMVLITSLL